MVGRIATLTRVLPCAALVFLSPVSAVPIGAETRAVPAASKMAREKLVLVIGGRDGAAARELPISVEIAASPEESAVGLMFRTELPEDQGMLFPSPAPREATMWMRNTLIPLDMVFIRADGVIHRIEAMTEPMSERLIDSRGPVLAVLELAGGVSAKLGLRAGDRVRHRIFKAGGN